MQISLRPFLKSPPIHQSGTGQSEGEGEPDARQAPIEHEAEKVAGWKWDDEIGQEGDVHDWLDIGNATEGVGVVALQTVTELVDDEWYDEAGYCQGDCIIVCKPTADFVSQ